MNYDEAKAEVLSLNPALVWAGRIARLARKEAATAGFVAWDSTLSGSVRCGLHTSHYDSFSEAVYTLLSFCWTEHQDEWLVVGRCGALVVRSMAKFNEVEGIPCASTHLIYIGRLGIIAVYMNPTLPVDEFYAGVIGRSAVGRGVIENAPTVGQPRERPRANDLIGDEILIRAFRAAINSENTPQMNVQIEEAAIGEIVDRVDAIGLRMLASYESSKEIHNEVQKETHAG